MDKGLTARRLLGAAAHSSGTPIRYLPAAVTARPPAQRHHLTPNTWSRFRALTICYPSGARPALPLRCKSFPSVLKCFQTTV